MILYYIILFGLFLVPLLYGIISIISKYIDQNDQDMSTDDSTESESVLTLQYNSEEWNSVGIARSLDTDAVFLGKRQGTDLCNLSPADVRDIEESLDDYEKISLIFLLSDNPEDCLNEIKLSEWAINERLIESHWEEKIWEALAIIKNFQIPKKYGFTKKHLEIEFFPYNFASSKYISRIRKILYLICENFNAGDESVFLKELRKQLKTENVFFPEFSQMEIYFSYFLKSGYINACAKVAKTLCFERAFDLLKEVSEICDHHQYTHKIKNFRPKETVSKFAPKVFEDQISGSSEFISLANSDSTQDNASTKANDNNIYNMDENKFCLIIDQKNFYTEKDEHYKHLLPPNIDNDKLHTRKGTEVDVNRLETVFKSKQFDIQIKKNLNHLKMIKTIEEFVKEINEKCCSCIFVIVLSHGDEGVVYCANSCYVKISTIIEKMDDKRFIDIPKVLILQTCQGASLQYDEELTTDGDTKKIEAPDPKSPNFFLFSSTVPGFATIRDKKKGTWFIQTLCDQLEQHGNEKHFLDICTNTVGKVSKERWSKEGKENYMVPYIRSTLGKALYI